MRGISAAVAALGIGSVAALTQGGPVLAEAPVSEVTGNWAGPGGGGFFFRARLEQAGDKANLTIWNGFDAVPAPGGDPDLRVDGFALAAFATDQHLEVQDTADGSVLLVVTGYADEEGEGREVVQVQFLDNQYTVIGYAHQDTFFAYDAPPVVSVCEVDVRAGKVIEDGRTRDLPAMDFEAANASAWHFGAAYDRGWCSRAGG